MKKQIFLDLDETLIHASYAGTLGSLFFNSEEPKLHPKLNVLETKIGCEYELYRGYLRPYAVQIVDQLNEEYGPENVFILTRASEDYAINFCRSFGINVHQDRILDRDCLNYTLSSREGFHAVLVDNLPERKLEDKIQFLNRALFSKVSTIQVIDFYGRGDDDTLKTIPEKIRSLT